MKVRPESLPWWGGAAASAFLSSWLRPEGAFLWVPGSFLSSLFRRLLSFCLPLTAQPIFNFQHWGRGARAQALAFSPPFSFASVLRPSSQGPRLFCPPHSPPVLSSRPFTASRLSVLLLSHPHRCCWLLGPPFPCGFSWRASSSRIAPFLATVMLDRCWLI